MLAHDARSELLGKALGPGDASSHLHVYASPFSRTVETAQIAAGMAGLTDFTNNFQVRFIGSHFLFHPVWLFIVDVNSLSFH